MKKFIILLVLLSILILHPYCGSRSITMNPLREKILNKDSNIKIKSGNLSTDYSINTTVNLNVCGIYFVLKLLHRLNVCDRVPKGLLPDFS